MFMPDAIKELQLQKLLRGFHKDEALCFALEGPITSAFRRRLRICLFRNAVFITLRVG